MNADEVQYQLDRRNHVDIPGRTGATDNEFDKPIQLGHLTGDVIIESSEWADIGYTGPPGRSVFEYNYTGVQDPPRIFFKYIRCRNPAVGTYNTPNVAFFRVMQPNTSPKFLFADHCSLANTGSYLFDGPDVCGCDGIQIKNMEGAGGSGMLRWRLRSGEQMGFLEINNTRYQTSDKVGPSTDLKNTYGIYFVTYTDEQNANLEAVLVGNYEGPLSHRFVNPRGYNFFEHNWNEYSTDWDTESPNCWCTSVRVDDTSGNYGMHFIRRYQTPFRWGGATNVFQMQFAGGHSSTNAGSLYMETLESFSTAEAPYREVFTGKMFPKSIDSWDLQDGNAATYTDLNSSGIRDRLSVYDNSSYPVLYGNTRTPYYNTEERQNRLPITPQGKDYEEVLADQARVAYGDVNSESEVDGSDLVITFKGSGTLTVTEEVQAEYLIVGGGGSGGAQNSAAQNGGGGGGGGVSTNFGGTKVTLAAGTYPIVVGTGGVFEWGTYGTGTSGGSSSFNGITIPGGGGGGGSEDLVTYTDGAAGGCGGGAAAQGGSSGGTGSAYGYAGGSSDEVSGASGASGGGGAGGVGGNGYLDGSAFGGNGGVGVSCSITGTAVIYGPGGGGGANNNSGDGGDPDGEGGWPRRFTPGNKVRDGVRNIGGGGGGGCDTTASVVGYPGDGGDGVVIVRITGGA